MSVRPDLTAKKPFPARTGTIGLVLLGAGLALAAAAYAVDPRHAAFTNVVAFLFLVSVGVGGTFLVALEHLSGAVWSVPMRRVNEFLGGAVVLALLAGIPLLFHLHDLFEWTHASTVAADKLLTAKAPYLNVQFFLLRFAGFFLLWLLFTWLFTRNSLRQDTTKDQRLTRANVGLAAVFMPVFALTLTFTAIDWAMSLEPHWYSTIIGVYYFSGTVLAALGITTYAVIRLVEGGHLPPLGRDHYYNLGALLFVFTNFWAYIAFSQFMLIWYANLPEETFWFMKRWEEGWQWVGIGLILARFAIPYFVLLPQDAKMDPKRLKFMGLWIAAAHLLDLYWLTMPAMGGGTAIGWIEIAFPLLIAGALILLFRYKMGRHNLVPVGDPKLERGLDFHL
jgi:hypothetical protein